MEIPLLFEVNTVIRFLLAKDANQVTFITQQLTRKG